MHYGANNQHDYDLYDDNGFCMLQIHCGPHGNPKKHPYGKKGEHVAEWIWLLKGNRWIGFPGNNRELTTEERRWMNDSLNDK